MRSLCKVLMLLALVAFIATPASAQGKKKNRKGKKGQPQTPVTQLENQLKKLELTEKQKEAIDEIFTKDVKKEILELAAKVNLSPEQKKAMADARKKAQADGVKGKAARDAVQTAANMSEDQKKANDGLQKLLREVRAKIAKVLTPEQRKQAKMGGQGQAGGRKKKNG